MFAAMTASGESLSYRCPRLRNSAICSDSIDSRLKNSDNYCMSNATIFSPELIAQMQEAADRAAKGVRDPTAMDRAFKEMDRIREELRQRIGTVNVAVDLVREARNQ